MKNFLQMNMRLYGDHVSMLALYWHGHKMKINHNIPITTVHEEFFTNEHAFIWWPRLHISVVLPRALKLK